MKVLVTGAEGKVGDCFPERPFLAEHLSCAKAGRRLGWRPTRSWRDDPDGQGRLRPLDERIR